MHSIGGGKRTPSVILAISLSISEVARRSTLGVATSGSETRYAVLYDVVITPYGPPKLFVNLNAISISEIPSAFICKYSDNNFGFSITE